MQSRLGKYLLVRRISQGGMAEVFLAKSFGTGPSDALFALKLIRAEHSQDKMFVDMFIDEAKLSVLLVHPNIARVYELGKIDGRYFLAKEYVAGQTLRSVLDRAAKLGRAMPAELAVGIAAQVLDGLEHAHRKIIANGQRLTIVHRDVTPQNVLIGYDGSVKLIDFGIAKALGASGAQSRVLKGKYAYMAPEQVRGLPVDARTDVFSTGVVLFEMLAARRLFQGESDMALMAQVKHAEVVPPSLYAPETSASLDALVLRSLALDAKDRFPSAMQMREALLEEALAHEGHAQALAGFMEELFAKECSAEREEVEVARAIVAMPETLAPLSSEEAGSDEEELTTDVDRPIEQTQLTPLSSDGAERKNRVILSVSLLVALALIVGAYILTR